MLVQSCKINHQILGRPKLAIPVFFFLRNKKSIHRSNSSEVFLRKGVRKICSKLITIEHPCRSVILIKLLCNYVEITLRHACSPVKTGNKNQLISAKAYSESNQTTNIERFAKTVNNFKPNYFYKTLHVRYLTGF